MSWSIFQVLFCAWIIIYFMSRWDYRRRKSRFSAEISIISVVFGLPVVTGSAVLVAISRSEWLIALIAMAFQLISDMLALLVFVKYVMPANKSVLH